MEDDAEYVLTADKPGYGRAGDVVRLSPAAAEYLVMGGAVVPRPSPRPPPRRSRGKPPP